MSRRGRYRAPVLFKLFSFLICVGSTAPASAAAYVAIELYKLITPSQFAGWSYNGVAQAAANGQLVATGFANSGHHALLWNNSGTATDLHPSNLGAFITSEAYATNGAQQVGSGYGAVTANKSHALLWNNTNVASDLNPTNLSVISSYAYGTNGNLQVGYGSGPDTSNSNHALLWHGTSTAIDLQPANLPGFTNSFADGTSDIHQVGSGYGPATGDWPHALLWSGDNVAIDLHPTNLTGFSASYAYATDGDQEVGQGVVSGNLSHALLWNGTSIATDLNPTNLDITNSYALATDGARQVGYGSGPATGGTNHALLWNGTSTAFDLHSLLPANYTGSGAYWIDDQGNIYGGAGDGTGGGYAVEWVLQTPEPASLSLFALGTLALARRRRRSATS